MAIGFIRKGCYTVQDLLEIMQILRSDEGCPWDREQTHATLRKNLIEETYELCEAIDTEDSALMCEELGDVLLQVVFHAEMERGQGGFCFDDVCDGICKKLILRHPHIFGEVTANTSEEVLRNWDAIKKQEKGQQSYTQTLEGVSKALPALMRSAKVQQRAARAGFDYPDTAWAMKDLRSEVEELEEAIAEESKAHAAEELGDLLFSAVNVSRFIGVDAEEALSAASEKFIARFAQVEKLAASQGIDMKAASIEELDKLWKKAKTFVTD